MYLNLIRSLDYVLLHFLIINQAQNTFILSKTSFNYLNNFLK
jgi:hypothetical protein